MKTRASRKILYGFFAVLTLGVLIYFAMRPNRIPVEIGYASKGALSITIDGQGKTRAHDRFVISAPVQGRLVRIELHEGDAISEGDVVALLNPLPLSEREKLEVSSRAEAAEAYRKETEQQAAQQQTAYQQAKRDQARAEQLAREGLIPPQQLEQARSAELIASKQLEAARFKARAASSELAVARAGLIALQPGGDHLVRLVSPVSGRVLNIAEKSERVVDTGTALLTLGDPSRLEVVVDFLSTDAVKIKAGDPVRIGEWGGEQILRGRVRLVEPMAFTKVSALGIEEQRVNIIADLLDPPGALGDGYLVECHVVIWSSPSVLKIPTTALFRYGQEWSVFVPESGKAQLRKIQVGHRNPSEAEITGGMKTGEPVILHPSNELEDGTAVRF